MKIGFMQCAKSALEDRSKESAQKNAPAEDSINNFFNNVYKYQVIPLNGEVS